VFTTIFYVTTTIALVVLVRPESIQILNGLGQGGSVAAVVLGLPWLTSAIAVLVLVSSIGGFGGLGAAVSRLPYAAGMDSLLPAAFSRVHPRWGTPYVSILVLGVLASLLLIALQLGDTLRAGYQSLVSLMVIAGFFPYLYMFAGAWKCGKRFSAASGMGVTALAIASSVVPTSDITNVWLFEFKLVAGTGVMILLAWWVYRRYRSSP
jgi:APA family basic amino acid/polyamine antiporter